MSTKIILFKTHKINLTNLAISQIRENSPDSFYDSCHYNLVQNKFFVLQLNNFAKHIGDVRNMDWSTNTEYLDKCLASEKQLLFGSHDDSQINFLKQYYKSDILTIGINYDIDMYQLLLTNVAEYHIYLLATGQITLSEHDEILLETMDSQNLVKYFANEFDSINLIPKSSFINCDYNILVNDFFDKSKMTDHFNNIGFPFTEESQQYYDQWANSNFLVSSS
jgi:hypothetical protein